MTAPEASPRSQTPHQTSAATIIKISVRLSNKIRRGLAARVPRHKVSRTWPHCHGNCACLPSFHLENKRNRRTNAPTRAFRRKFWGFQTKSLPGQFPLDVPAVQQPNIWRNSCSVSFSSSSMQTNRGNQLWARAPTAACVGTASEIAAGHSRQPAPTLT